jgi:hypothetical protein
MIRFITVNRKVMEVKEKNVKDRVRENTSEEKNAAVDAEIISQIAKYKNLTKEEISDRLEELRKEWDIERTLGVNASSFALAGLLLGTFVNKRWFLLSGIVTGFLLQYGVQGWCPPLPLFRAMGIRTRQDIDEEIYAMKVLRGDFENLSAASTARKILTRFRK